MVNSKKYSNVEQNPIVTMEMTSGEIVKIELYPQIAPTTVENFISLINKGFYDGLTFHRVMPEFMAQGGDPSGDGTGGPGYSIYGEFSENGFSNDLKHEIGVISMARANEPNSAGSQFFIVTNDQSYLSLDGKYAGFGKVIEGMDVVYRIVNSETMRKEYSANIQKLIKEGGEIDSIDLYYQYLNETTEMTRPKNPPTIKKMTVETFDVEYAEPEKIEE
ncbi:MAG: peptidylprolyl isomerase [Clostridia bacterium]|nr:peptidylprolyl isomerase [Clostridia bacterium]